MRRICDIASCVSAMRSDFAFAAWEAGRAWRSAAHLLRGVCERPFRPCRRVAIGLPMGDQYRGGYPQYTLWLRIEGGAAHATHKYRGDMISRGESGLCIKCSSALRKSVRPIIARYRGPILRGSRGAQQSRTGASGAPDLNSAMVRFLTACMADTQRSPT